MSDNLRRYRAICHALMQAYPTSPTGHFARHLQTLAALMSGIVGGKSTQLPHIATKVPDGSKPESRVKRFARWLDNDRILEEMYFIPYVETLLIHLALETLVLVMDGSVVGRDCTALMIHVLYKGRALPLAWRVRQGPKGHFPEDLHIAVVELIREVIPEGAQVVFLGDGEFDGTALQATLNEAGWSYACRTALSTVATWEGTTFRLDTLGACSKPGTLIALQEVKFTRSAYGPVMVLSCWAKGYQEPLYLVSNMDDAEVGRPNRRFTVDQLLGSECPRRLFDARWPCIFNDQGLIWNYALRSIVFFINPFHTDSCLIIGPLFGTW
jgi:hypothetical protein